MSIYLELFLVFLKKRGGIGKRLHPEHKRVHKIKNPPDKRYFKRGLPRNNTLIILYVHGDLSVRPAHSNGIFSAVPHHYALEDRLSANI